MEQIIDYKCTNNNIREMTSDEINCVSGAGSTSAGSAVALAGAIGAATFGSTWAAVGVGAAFVAAPVAVVAMVGLAAYAGYSYFTFGGTSGEPQRKLQ